MLKYCKKCGNITRKMPWDNNNYCKICNSILFEVPDEYLLVWKNEIDHDTIDQTKQQRFIEECVKSSPEFDEQLFNSRDEILAKENAKYDQAMKIGNAIRQGADLETAFKNNGENMPKCPTCGSHNIERISGMKRFVSTGLFGLTSSNIGKTMHCKNCGCKW